MSHITDQRSQTPDSPSKKSDQLSVNVQDVELESQTKATDNEKPEVEDDVFTVNDDGKGPDLRGVSL